LRQHVAARHHLFLTGYFDAERGQPIAVLDTAACREAAWR
jgi:hypothetical protein